METTLSNLLMGINSKSLSLSKSIFGILILLGIATTEAFSQKTDSSIINKTHRLEEVIVTGTRTEEKLQDIPRKVEVITNKEIQSTQAVDFTDLLKKHAGVDVVQYPGMLAGVGIRGFRPQYGGINQRTLLLIDGRPAGATNISLININNIERVEVLKGPASALYGSQAMGGVINIITKKTIGRITGRVFGGLGSFNVSEGGFSVGGSITKKLDFDLSLTGYKQAKDYKLGNGNMLRDAFGFDKAQRIEKLEDNRDSTYSINDATRDGANVEYTKFSKYSASARLGYQLNNNWRVDIKGDKLEANKVNSPGDLLDNSANPNRKDLDRYSSDVLVSGKLGSKNTASIKAFYANENTINYGVPFGDTSKVLQFYKSYASNYRWRGFQIQDNQQIGSSTLTVGIDYSNTSEIASQFSKDGTENAVSSRYPNSELITTGIYFQEAIHLLNNKLDITAGGRFESIKNKIIKAQDFAGRSDNNHIFNPSLGLNFNFNNNLRFRSSLGRAFTTVSAFSVAGYHESSVWGDANKADVWKGNADLKNQSSVTFDLGAEYNNKQTGIQAEVTWFKTKLNDNMLTTASPATSGETAASGKQIRLIYTFNNAESSDLSGIEAGLSYDFGALSNYKYSLKVFANAVGILNAKEVLDVYLIGKTTANMQNVANLTLNYGIEYNNSKRLSLRLSGRYVGYRYDTDWSFISSTFYSKYADIKYPGFMVMDLTSTVKITRNHHLSLLINNLTDENYYEKRGYNLAGRNAIVRYSFNF